MLIIDAYNVLHQWHGNPSAGGPGEDVRALGRLIRRGDEHGGRVALVCDGVAPGDGGVPVPGVEVVYAGAGHSADDVIIEMVRRSSAARRATVVSSDRAVASGCRRLGATVVDSRTFLARLVAGAARVRGTGASTVEKPQPPLPLGDAETGVWMAYFGVKGDAVAREQPARSANPKEKPRQGAAKSPPSAPRAASVPAEPASRVSRHSPTSPDFDEAETEPWFDEAARVWPGLTVQDLLMSRWLDGRGTRNGGRR